MINTARQYLGINEFQKQKLMDYYNSKIYPLIDNDRKYKIQPNDNWCAMFCSVIAHKIGRTKDNFPFEVSVFYMTRNAKKMGIFTTDLNKAQVNDLVVYDWKADGTLNHVGILQEIGTDYIKVLEGNYSNTVKVRTVKMPNSEVYGYIKLNIGNDADIEQLARNVINGAYGYGEDRKKALGANYEAVQARVNEILK